MEVHNDEEGSEVEDQVGVEVIEEEPFLDAVCWLIIECARLVESRKLRHDPVVRGRPYPVSNHEEGQGAGHVCSITPERVRQIMNALFALSDTHNEHNYADEEAKGKTEEAI